MQSSLAPPGVILRGFANSLDRPQNINASQTESSMDRKTKTVRQLEQVFRPTHDIRGVEGKKAAVPHQNVSAK
jgi:hypothetical protein